MFHLAPLLFVSLVSAPLDSAVTLDDLDAAQCAELPANPRDENYIVDAKSLPGFLRIAGPPPPHTFWRTGMGPEAEQHLRLAFTRPVAVGTVLAVTTGRVSYLRPQAAYPGDMAAEADWVPLDDPHPAGSLRVIPLPPGLRIRALRFSFHHTGPEPHRSEIAALRLLQGRFVNLAWDAVPLASSAQGKDEREREEFGQQGLNDGQPGDLQGGQWRNLPGEPLSEEQPAWAALLWDRPVRVDAVGFVNAFANTIAVDTFRGPNDVHPLTAPAETWHEDARVTVPVPWRPPVNDVFVPLPQPTTTRCLRARFVAGLTNENPDVTYQTKGQPVHARLGELLALRDIGTMPVGLAVAQEGTEFEARTSDNRGQDAVPAPATVTVDGDLSEWDTSGGLFICPDTSALLTKASAWGYAMYDVAALYLAVDCNDPTPLGNQHDPASEPGLGWGGDCAQLRLVTDRVTHLTVWYSKPANTSVVHVAYGADFDQGEIPNAATKPGVQVAFRERPDASGYALELRLPWDLITTDGKARAPGDKLQLLYDLKWGTRTSPEVSFSDNLSAAATTHDGNWRSPATWGTLRLSATGHLPQSTPPWLTPKHVTERQGPIEIRYTLPALPAGAEGWEVTLVVDDATGHRVRNLFSGEPRQPGEVVDPWDGRTDLGVLASPGAYRFKAIYRAPLHLRYQFTVDSAGSPPWLSGTTGGWLSDHATPQAACAVGDQVFIGAEVAEAGHTLLAVDLDGHKLWGTKWLNLAGAQALATDGTSLFVGSEGGWIGAKLQVNLVDPRTYQFRNVLEETFEKREELPGLVGLAARDGKVYLALKAPARIDVYALPAEPDKKAERVGQLPLPEPGGLAFDTAGNLWAVSGNQVVRFDGAQGEAPPVVTEGLDEPHQLAFDAAGNLYVSDGLPSDQVKVFSRAGKLLRTVGQPGGRKLGPFQPECLDNPQGVAIDAKGRLWVCENARQPKRVTLWSADGRLLRAFHGPTRYGGSGYLDATDRTRMVDDGMTFMLDWDQGTWQLTDLHYRLGAAPGMVFERTPGRSWSYRRRVFHSNYDYWTSRYLVLYERLADGRIVPLAAAGRADQLRGHTVSGVSLWAEDRFAERRGGRDPADLDFVWSDLNRDGEQQPEEVQFVRCPAGGVEHWPWEALWSMWVAEDGSFVVAATGNGPTQYAWRLPAVRWQDNGAPVYDAAHPVVIADVPRRKVPVYGNMVQSVLTGSDGRAILVANPITGCDDQGKPLWTYEDPWPGVHGSHSAPSWRPGMVIGGQLALGTAHLDGDLGEIAAISGNKGQIYLFTADGLLVGTLFQDCRLGQPWNLPKAERGMLLDDLTLGEEHFGGHFTRTSDGRYYLVVGFNHSSIVEVEGLDTLHRLDGRFEVDAATAAECERLAHEEAHDQAQREAPRFYGVARAAQAPAVDGDLADWSGREMIAWEGSTGKARAGLSYDDERLYLAYEVTDETPLLNHGADWRLLFKTGDAVDLQLGTDAKADPNRRDAAPGDLRLLITALPDGDKLAPLAVLYRQQVPGAPEAGRTTFASPWRSVVMDEVRRLDEAKVAVLAVPGQRRYVVEAALPLATLGLQPSPGLRLPVDFGVLFGDAAGETTIERCYWSNHAVNFTSDVPGEAMLYPNLWGMVEWR